MNKTYFYHGELQDGMRFTAAGKVQEDNSLVIGFSLCSEKDQFNKKLGRVRAEGRMKAQAETRGQVIFEDNGKDRKYPEPVKRFLFNVNMLAEVHPDKKGFLEVTNLGEYINGEME